MFQQLDCLALRTVRLNESKNLLSTWTRQMGRVTFAMPAGNSREARRRRALCSPLATFEAVCDVKPGRDILSLRDLRPAPASLAIAGDPLKGMTALFLSEVLDLLLRRTEADTRLSDFLFASVEALSAMDDPRAAANFHLVFLYRLAFFAGIQPDLSDYSPGAVFDLRDATFRRSHPMHRDFIHGRECSMLMALSRTDYTRAGRIPADRDGRRRILDLILRYYELHLTSLDSLKSLDVLRDLSL